MRDQTALYHFCCLAGNWTVSFQQSSLVQFAKSLSAVSLQLSEVSCSRALQGDVAHDIYPILDVHQRIFNQLIQILH